MIYESKNVASSTISSPTSPLWTWLTKLAYLCKEKNSILKNYVNPLKPWISNYSMLRTYQCHYESEHDTESKVITYYTLGHVLFGEKLESQSSSTFLYLFILFFIYSNSLKKNNTVSLSLFRPNKGWTTDWAEPDWANPLIK